MNLRKDLPHIQLPRDCFKVALEVFKAVGAMEAPCCMSLHQREVLFNLAVAIGATRILDIGTYIGFSALNYAIAVGHGGEVVTVDTVTNHHEYVGAKSPAELWQQAGVADIVTPVQSASLEYLGSNCGEFDLISIDGWHEDFCVYAEVQLALERLRPNGIIFLDDVQPLDFEPRAGFDRFYGPARAVGQILDQHKDIRFAWITQTSGVLVQR